MDSSLHFCAFLLLYAFGFWGFLVTGLNPPQLPRFAAFNSRCFFFDSFSKGINFSIFFLLSIRTLDIKLLDFSCQAAKYVIRP